MSMQANWLFALLLTFTLTMAGCFGDDSPADDHCDDGHVDADCPDNGDHGDGDDHGDGNMTDDHGDGNMTDNGDGNNTGDMPNVPPTVVVTVTDAGGNQTLSVLQGGSLTFDITGSSDEDGELTDAAIIIEDGNGTRFAPLVDAGEFTTATFDFLNPGVVDVTINALDNDGDKTEYIFDVYVDEPQNLGSKDYTLADPAVSSADSCAGPIASEGAGNNPIDPLASHTPTFRVREGAQWVEAFATGDNSIAICAPDGTAISDAASDYVRSTAGGHMFNASADYYVMVYAGTPGTTIEVSVIVHYEPEVVEAASEEAA